MARRSAPAQRRTQTPVLGCHARGRNLASSIAFRPPLWMQGEGGGAAVRVDELWPTPRGLRVDRGLQLPAVAGPQLCQGPVTVRGAGHEAGTHRFTMRRAH